MFQVRIFSVIEGLGSTEVSSYPAASTNVVDLSEAGSLNEVLQ